MLQHFDFLKKDINLTKRKILLIPVFLLTFLTLSAQKPVNDECSAAVDLTNILPNEIGQTNTSELFTNVASTGEKWLYPALKNCGWYDKDFTGEALKHPCPECGAQSCESPSVDQTVWFKFTGDGEDYQIRVRGSSVDPNATMTNSQMSILTGSCENFQLVTASDDEWGWWGMFNSGRTLSTKKGVQYYIVVDGHRIDSVTVNEGSFKLTFTKLTSMKDYDECENPLSINELFSKRENSVGPFHHSAENGGLTPDDQNVAPCWSDSKENFSAWYSFEGVNGFTTIKPTDCNGVSFFGGNMIQMALYEGDCSSDLKLVGCNDGATGWPNTWANLSFSPDPTKEYLLRVDSREFYFQGMTFSPDGSYCLSATTTTTGQVQESFSSKFNLVLIREGSTRIVQWDDSHGEVNLQLIDAIGRTIWSSLNIKVNTTNLPDLIPGNYILCAHDKDGNRGKIWVQIN